MFCLTFATLISKSVLANLLGLYQNTPRFSILPEYVYMVLKFVRHKDILEILKNLR